MYWIISIVIILIGAIVIAWFGQRKNDGELHCLCDAADEAFGEWPIDDKHGQVAWALRAIGDQPGVPRTMGDVVTRRIQHALCYFVRPEPLPEFIPMLASLQRAKEMYERERDAYPPDDHDAQFPEADAEMIGAAIQIIEQHVPRTADDLEYLRARVAQLEALINTPQTDDWLEAVKLEAAHQIERWGVDHDKGKKPEDYFWLIGYLSSKALVAANAPQNSRYRHIKTGGTYELLSAGEDEHQRVMVAVYRGESDGKVWTRPWNEFFDGRFESLPSIPNEKALHHTISTGAALLNWWRRMKGIEVTFQPGHAPTIDQENPNA